MFKPPPPQEKMHIICTSYLVQKLSLLLGQVTTRLDYSILLIHGPQVYNYPVLSQ